MTFTSTEQPNVHMNDVIYNATNQSFEALVIVGTATGEAKYPCAIDAPITMSFEDASAGLMTQALRRHSQHLGLRSQMRQHAPTQRAGRPRFDPRVWLAQLGFCSIDKAA